MDGLLNPKSSEKSLLFLQSECFGVLYDAMYYKTRVCYRHRPPFTGFSTRQAPRWSLTSY